MKENAELPKSSMKYKLKKNRKNRSPFSHSPAYNTGFCGLS